MTTGKMTPEKNPNGCRHLSRGLIVSPGMLAFSFAFKKTLSTMRSIVQGFAGSGAHAMGQPQRTGQTGCPLFILCDLCG